MARVAVYYTGSAPCLCRRHTRVRWMKTLGGGCVRSGHQGAVYMWPGVGTTGACHWWEGHQERGDKRGPGYRLSASRLGYHLQPSAIWGFPSQVCHPKLLYLHCPLGQLLSCCEDVAFFVERECDTECCLLLLLLQGGTEKPSLCSGFVTASRRPRGLEKARILWQIWQNPQSSDQPEYVLCWIPGECEYRPYPPRGRCCLLMGTMHRCTFQQRCSFQVNRTRSGF